MGAYTPHAFNHSTLGKVTFYSFLLPRTPVVQLKIDSQPDWNLLKFENGKWNIHRHLTSEEVIAGGTLKELAPGQFSLALCKHNTMQQVDSEILDEILVEFKKSAPYKHARKVIRQLVREAKQTINKYQRDITTLIHSIEYQKQFLDVNISGL